MRSKCQSLSSHFRHLSTVDTTEICLPTGEAQALRRERAHFSGFLRMPFPEGDTGQKRDTSVGTLTCVEDRAPQSQPMPEFRRAQRQIWQEPGDSKLSRFRFSVERSTAGPESADMQFCPAITDNSRKEGT
jgi:hypothetical protein